MAKKAQASTKAANKPAARAGKVGTHNVSGDVTTEVLSNLKHNGVLYKTGSHVTLDPKTYSDLLAKGVVSPASDTAVESSGDLTQKEDDTNSENTNTTEDQKGGDADKVDGGEGEGADSEDEDEDEE